MKIIIAGGQTGGPIMPLLAVVDEIKREKHRLQLVVLDTPTSIASALSEKEKFHFYPIRTGKLRRYWSFKNALAPVTVVFGFLQALRVMYSFKPAIVLGAGGFVQVPVVWAAWLLRIPVLLHQQDISPSLSNSLSAPMASKITTTFAQSQRDFPSGFGFFGSHKKHKEQSVIWTGNPFRESLAHASKEEARKYFKLTSKLPVLLVIGGSSGAKGLNNLLYRALAKLTKTVQIIHVTGPGKKQPVVHENYHAYEFIDRIDLAYAISDMVISRAGISTITELANLGKISIVIPMPHTHQEHNAQLLYERQAAVVLDQTITTPEKVISVVRGLLLDGETQKLMKKNITELMPKKSAEKIAKIVMELVSHGK